ncbi:NAD-dependent epimerase/dehydratase family protein [Tissierella pigra]|uniref:UDP-glucose 4-epimerase n=1 Tax=Tissierella pigra TaxID=2607614 RepID=A0A6N7XFR9_9FIRM|nr:NAD-dependent epimerase/dehydratase family protein [Tissierella pigra]MBU5425565.1 NAD-dependent epimerase/dehydratase family protein [Tissierella pigra]MSU00881.1 NAD-dependent epimerase/dehydratase family protein [Tissierella pigra]
MKKKVLIMGGSYFIGKKIVDVFCENKYDVFTLNRGTKVKDLDNVHNLICDRNDMKQMENILSQYKFNIVIDVSGLNKEQGEILYKSLNKQELESFIFISSSAVYDVDILEFPFKESDLLKENTYWTSYGKNKIEAEDYYIENFRDSSIDLIILRPPYVYGENNYAQRESFIFDHICKDRPIIIPNPNTYLQFIYTTDLANIIIELLKAKKEKVSIFNVGNKKPVTIKEWIEYCAEVVGKEAKIIEYDYKSKGRKERDFFPFYDYSNVLDVDKINYIYSEETDFIMGLKNSYNWYLTNKDSISFKEDIICVEEEIFKELGINTNK